MSDVNVAVPFNNIEHRDANIIHKITIQYLALKGGTPLRDRRDRRLPLRDHTATYLPSAKTALDRTRTQVKS